MMYLSANAGEILGDAGMTMLIGIVVVFAVLLLLTAIFKLFGVVAGAAEQKVKDASTPVAASAAPVAAPMVGNTAEVKSSMELDNAIEPETVAVISAAVASMAPAGTQYVVTDIRKA